MKTITSTIKLLSIGLLSLFLFTGCVGPSSIDAGEEAVLIYKPWIFGHGGVDETPVTTGLVWTAWSTEVQRVNVKPFILNETFDDLITKDNNPIDFKIHLTFQHIQGKTPILVKNFGFAKKDEETFKNGDSLKKKLLICTLENWEIDFFKDIVELKTMQRLKEVKYLDDKLIAEWFEYRYENIIIWHSIKKRRLKHGLHNTPVCFIFHLWSTLKMLESLHPLFGKPMQYETKENICRKCHLFYICEGTKKYRS